VGSSPHSAGALLMDAEWLGETRETLATNEQFTAENIVSIIATRCMGMTDAQCCSPRDHGLGLVLRLLEDIN